MKWRLQDYNTLSTTTIAVLRWLYQTSGASEWWPLALIGLLLVGGIVSYLLLNSGAIRMGYSVNREIAVRDERIADLKEQLRDTEHELKNTRAMLMQSVGINEEQRQVLHIAVNSDEAIAIRRRNLADALTDAYRSRAALAQMLLMQMNVKLDNVADGDNLKTLVTSLLEWAESQGRDDELIEAAIASNPGNKLLKAFDGRK